jgi:hypothetical protein
LRIVGCVNAWTVLTTGQALQSLLDRHFEFRRHPSLGRQDRPPRLRSLSVHNLPVAAEYLLRGVTSLQRGPGDIPGFRYLRRGDKDNWFSLIQNKPNQAQVEGTNGNAKPQSSGESVDSVANTPTDDARAELELEKIKLERERIELEREKLKMQNQSNSGPITNEPKIAADQIPAPATSTGSATVPAMPGERYPETRLRLLGQADLIDLNLNDLRYAINEMYARRGVVFKNVEIAKSFTNKEWFKPRPGVSFEEIEKEFSAIEADNLKLLGKERERKAASADLYQLIDSESNLREGPGTNYPIVRKSRKGEVGEALSNKNGWMKLQFSDGSMAWAHEQNLKAAK